MPGASVPPPFGGKYRQIMAYVNRDALQARGLTLMDVVHALNRANLIIPAGDAKIGTTDYFVYTNSMIENPDDINQVPVKIGNGEAPVFVGRRRPRRGRGADSTEHRAHQRAALRLHPGTEAERRQHDRDRRRGRGAIAEDHRAAQRNAASRPSSVRRLYVRSGGRRLEHEAVSGSDPRLADDPDFPRQLPLDVRDLSFDPALDSGRRFRSHHDGRPSTS